MGAEGLKRAIRRLRGPVTQRAKVDLSPDTPFDALLEERMRSLERHVDEVKARVNGLLFLVVGAVVAQVVLNLMG